MRCSLLSSTMRRFGAKVKGGKGGKKDELDGLTCISDFWYGDKITVWDRNIILSEKERSLPWMNPTDNFIKTLKLNFEKDLDDQTR